MQAYYRKSASRLSDETYLGNIAGGSKTCADLNGSSMGDVGFNDISGANDVIVTYVTSDLT